MLAFNYLNIPLFPGQMHETGPGCYERLWDFIEKLDINTFGKYLWAQWVYLTEIQWRKETCVCVLREVPGW